MKINKAKFLRSVFKRSSKSSIKCNVSEDMIKLLNTLDGEKQVREILIETGFSAGKVGKIIVGLYKLGPINFVLQNIILLGKEDFSYISNTLTRFVDQDAEKYLENGLSNAGFNRFDWGTWCKR